MQYKFDESKYYNNMTKSWKKAALIPTDYMKDYEWKTTTKNIRNFKSEQREIANILTEEEDDDELNELYNETYEFNKVDLPEGDEFQNVPQHHLLVQQRDLALKFNDLVLERLDDLYKRERYVPNVKTREFSKTKRSQSVEKFINKVNTMSERNRNFADIITPKTSNEQYDYKIKSALKRMQETMLTEKKASQPNSANTSFDGSMQGSLFSGVSGVSNISKNSSMFKRVKEKIPKSKLANPFD